MLIRVAYVVYRFDVGGLERCVANLCNHLDRSRFRPMVVCLDRSGTASQWLERDDVEVVELHKRAGNDLGVVRRLARVLRERSVGVIHSHNWGTLVETAAARRWAKTPVHVHTEHGQGLHDGLSGIKAKLRRAASRWAFEKADAVLVCAESVRPLVAARSGFPESWLVFMPNGVPNPLEEPVSTPPYELRWKLGIPQDALVVGSLGRLAPVKDFGAAIDAISLISSRIDAHLVLVGDGPEEERLTKYARERGIPERIHLAGRQTNVGDWLRLFDVYVNCSRSEAMSMGVLEAMGAGVPVVATDVGENRALVEAEPACGVIVRPGRIEELAAAVERLCRNKGEREWFSRSGKGRHAVRYSTAAMAENHAELYERLRNGGATRFAATQPLAGTTAS